MPRKWSKAVPEGNGPVPHLDDLGSRRPMMADLYRMFGERFNRRGEHLEMVSELTGMLRATKKRLAGLEHEARQPRLATEANVEPDKKTRKRTRGASAADRAKNGDISSLRRVDVGPTSLTSFGIIDEPPAPEKLIGNALVGKGAEAPKPCLSPIEMGTPTAAGGLLPVGTASTATKTTFPPPPRWNFCPIEEMNFRTTTLIQTYAT